MENERAIETLKKLCKFFEDCETDAVAIKKGIEALEKQTPKKPKHIHKEYSKHEWEKDDDGNVDTFAWGFGCCNGPICERCGKTPCEHCNPDYDNEKCIVDKYLCPTCHKEVNIVDSPKGCRSCLQSLYWS